MRVYVILSDSNEKRNRRCCEWEATSRQMAIKSSIFEKWFQCSPYSGHVLGIERHEYGQKMGDCILDVEEVRQKVEQFVIG